MLALAYVPALATAPGVVAADTKQYLYLDPGSFLARARTLWDTSQFGGYVTHQQVGYLWPMGPWFWLTHAAGVPVWVAQRLWVGTLIALAAFGARRFARRLGLDTGAALVTALAYGFSPYLLTYVSRTSVLLLPWAALGWVMVLTMRALEDRGWRAPAALGVVIATVGSVNATAVVLVGIGPALLAVDAVVGRRVGVGEACRAALRTGVCCVATSLWWIVALIVEGRYGAAVLRYSETIAAVSTTSSSIEVARGLGYWLFYGSLVEGPWNAAAPPYLTNPLLIALTTTIAAAGLAGLTLLRWRARRPLLWMLAAGAVVAVGAHAPRSPYGQLLGGPLARSTVALALRSSTRAVPLVVLALACGLGAVVAAVGTARPRLARPAAAAAGVLALLQLPALGTGGYVDGLLRRPGAIPVWWRDAAAELDRRGGGRVLELPGQEFAAYRWGTTTDPILPGLTARGLLTRDLLPLGGDQRMNLLYALDQRFQDGTVEPAAVAPVARLLGATDVVARFDANWERYRTPAPGAVWNALDGAPGLSPAVAFGPVQAGDSAHPTPAIDADGRLAEAPGAVAVFGVERTPAAPRVAPVAGSTIVAGDGDGVVDAAAAGLVDGAWPLVYAADLAATHDRAAGQTGDGGADRAVLDGARLLVVTDSNRASARQWRGTQDVAGFTEDGTGTDVVTDEADARLSPFGQRPTAGSQTVAVQRGTWTATASAYGEPNALRPEDRAFNAVDGDDATAWRVGDRADPVGQYLVLRTGQEADIDAIRLLQVQGTANRRITNVTIEVGGERHRIALGDASLRPPGQLVPIERAKSASVRVTIDATDVPAPPSFFGLDAVGFAEVTVGASGTTPAPTVERVVLPTSLDPATDAASADVAVVLTRQRVDPANRWRSDPERSLDRAFRLPGGDTALSVTTRLDARASDAVVASLLGLARAPIASSSLSGTLSARPWAATDGDPGTAWTSAVGDVVGAWWQAPLVRDGDVGELALRVVDDDRHSVPRAIRVTIGATTDEVALPPAGPDGLVHVALPAPRRGDAVRIEVTDAAVRTAIDRRYGEAVELPVAFTEIAVPGVATLATTVPEATIDTGCRDDLLSIDGRPISLRVHGQTADALRHRPLAAEPCDASSTSDVVRGGPDHALTTGVGAVLGIDVDRVVLSKRRPGSRPPAAVTHAPVAPGASPTDYAVPVGPGESRWLVVPDAVNDGWRATLDGRDLGRAHAIDGGAAAWLLPAGNGGTVRVRWTPQRWADGALALSAAAAAACAAFAAGGAIAGVVRRRTCGGATGARSAPATRAAGAPLWSPAPSGFDMQAGVGRPVSRRAAVLATAAAGAVVATFVHPAYGVFVIVAVAAGWRRPSRLALRLAGPISVLVGGAYVVVRQLLSRPAAGFGWPLAHNAVHRPVLTGIVLAALAVSADGRMRREDGAR